MSKTTEAIDEAVDAITRELQKERARALSIARHNTDRGHGAHVAWVRDFYAAQVAVLDKLLEAMDEPGFDPSPADLRKALV